MAYMYNNKFVACILVDGKPQKELSNGVVELPYGTEYAFRFRNKNNRRAVVTFTIDGENVSGNGYIIDAQSFIDIERFSDVAQKFRLVADDSEAAIDQGKNHVPSAARGLIEAKFCLEKERLAAYEPLQKPWRTPSPFPRNPYKNPSFPPVPYEWECTIDPNDKYLRNDTLGLMNAQCNATMKSRGRISLRGQTMGEEASVTPMGEVPSVNFMATSGYVQATPVASNAVTVEGAASDQRFTGVYFNAGSFSTTVTLRLKGCIHKNQKNVVKAERVSNKLPQCTALATFITRRRNRLNIPIMELATITGLDLEYLVSIENFTCSRTPDDYVISKLSEALDVPRNVLDDLLLSDYALDGASSGKGQAYLEWLESQSL
jgi:hypothetical protein